MFPVSLRSLKRPMAWAATRPLMLQARLQNVPLRLTVHPTARVEPGVIFRVEVPHRPEPITVDIGAGARLERGAIVRLAAGATLRIGEGSMVRSTAVLNVSGVTDLRGQNLISWGTVVHCAERVVLMEMSGTGEGVSIVDAAHYREHDADHWYGRSVPAPILVGRNVWLASHCVVGKGVTIGDAATVGAGSVVLEDVPPSVLVAGTPARVVRTDINSGWGLTGGQ